MEKGQLVPDDLIIDIVYSRMQEADCMEKGFLLDGFPRTQAQAEAMVAKGIQVDAFVFLEVADDLLVERACGRRMDPETGKIYHIKYNPAPDEEIAARLTQRADDTEESMAVRLATFHKHMNSVLHSFKDKLFKVNGNKDKQMIFYDIKTMLDQLQKFCVVFVLGGPGSGKGTQCANMVRDYGYIHLSAGDLLRAERNSGSEQADLINSYIKEGKIVPVEITVGLIKKAMEDSGGRKFLIDGFPRNIDNLEGWFRVMPDDEVTVQMVLFFDCPEDTMTERLLNRGKTSGRIDDNMEAIRKRFRTFYNESMPVVAMFKKYGIVRIISSIPPPDVVYSQVKQLLDGMRLVPTYQRTLAMIKPDAVRSGKADEIINRLQDEGFVVVAKREEQLSRERAAQFYAEHQGRPFYEALLGFMTSGPAVALALERVNAIKGWRELMGPTNTEKARAEAPNSLRALYGTDGTQNATHGSDSVTSAIRELTFWFPEEDLAKECTLGLIKPNTALLHQTQILSILATMGFKVVLKQQLQLTKEKAEEFYGEHRGKAFFPKLVQYMTSGDCVALLLQREGAIKGWRAIMGPTNTERARQDNPQSIRGKYGIDGTMNATHGSDSPHSAAREIMFYFPNARNLLTPSESGPKQPASEQEILDYMRTSIDPIFAPMLQKILVERPTNVKGFAIKYLSSS